VTLPLSYFGLPSSRAKKKLYQQKCCLACPAASTAESSAGADVSVKGYIVFSLMCGTTAPAAACGRSRVYLILK